MDIWLVYRYRYFERILIAMFDTFLRFLGLLFDILSIPLVWMPDSCLAFLSAVFVIFGVVLGGKVLRWVWDFLPIA